MAQDRVADRDKLLAEAWARWFKEDYSWEGLLDPRKETEGFESRQHYWRTDLQTGEVRDDDTLIAAGELILADGQKAYHIAHLPLRYENGRPTAKTTPGTATEIHNHLLGLIEGRLQAAAHEGLSGAHLQGLVTGDTLDLSTDRINYPVRVNFNLAVLAEVSFYNAIFSSDVSFDKATFSKDARFDYATFSDYAGFYNVTFSGYTSFNNATFSGNSSFAGAIFLDYASFCSVNFSGTSGFEGATFSGDIRFDTTAFLGYTGFENTTFSGDVSFNDTIFSGEAGFYGTNFSATAMFDNANFLNDTSFDNATFSGVASFDKVKFSTNIYYGHGHFLKPAAFLNITWPKNATFHHKAFFNATFEGLADFSGSGFRAFAAFDGAIFKQGLRFDKIERSSATGKRRFEAQARHHFNNELAACKTESDDDFGPEQRLEELENGCRLLKQEMIKQGDKSREQILYKFELLARRAQKSTALSEKALSYLYGWFSDYGGSALRPLVWLVGIWLGFSLLFSTFLFSVSPPRPVPAPVALVAPASLNGSCKDALHLPVKASDRLPLSLSVSASRIFPFGAFEDVSKRLVSAYDCEGYTGRALGFRLLATVESFLALTLAFLFGLAVRRRFQIS